MRPHDEVQAPRCAEVLLGTRGFAVVVLDLADGLSPALARRLASVWPRLERQAAASSTALLLLSRERLAGSFAGLCLGLDEPRPLWPRHRLGVSLFAGFASRAEIVRSRRFSPGASAELRS